MNHDINFGHPWATSDDYLLRTCHDYGFACEIAYIHRASDTHTTRHLLAGVELVVCL
jgi:hypothetical protein